MGDLNRLCHVIWDPLYLDQTAPQRTAAIIILLLQGQGHSLRGDQKARDNASQQARSGRRPRCGICSLNLACRRSAGQQQNNVNAGSMLIRQKVHIGQIFNFRAFFWAVDADWTVRNERLPSACILVVSWAYGQIYGSGRLAALS